MRASLKTAWTQPNTPAYVWFLPAASAPARPMLPARRAPTTQLPVLTHTSALGENRRFWRTEVAVGGPRVRVVLAGVLLAALLSCLLAAVLRFGGLPLYQSLYALSVNYLGVYALGLAAALSYLPRPYQVAAAVLLIAVGAIGTAHTPATQACDCLRAEGATPIVAGAPVGGLLVAPAYRALAVIAAVNAPGMPHQARSHAFRPARLLALQPLPSSAWAIAWVRSTPDLGKLSGQLRQLLLLQGRARTTLGRSLAANAGRQTELGQQAWSTGGQAPGTLAHGTYALTSVSRAAHRLPAAPAPTTPVVSRVGAFGATTAPTRASLSLVQPPLTWAAANLGWAAVEHPRSALRC